jgi:cyanophycinase
MEKSKNECPVPNGVLLLIGGAEKKKKNKGDIGTDVLDNFLKLIDKPNPTIELITTAGEEDVEETFKTYEKTFTAICNCKVNHFYHQKREDIDEKSMAKRINDADAIFFAGGDQLRLTSIYGGTMLMYQIKQRYIHERLIIAGTSAGAMAMSTPMIFAGTGEDEMIAGEVKVTTGFEFLKDVCVDTHFVNRGRFVRMAQVIATNPSCIGIGIEEDTAMVIQNGKEATIIGCGVVIVIDGKQITGNNITSFDKEKKISIRNLKVSILSDGEQFEIPQLNPPHQ